MTLAEAVRLNRPLDLEKVRSTTDEEIARQIAEDPDTAPDINTLGPPSFDVRQLREKLGMSQDAFARALAIPVGTIRNWEQRRTVPDPSAVSLLRIVARDPQAAFRALGTHDRIKPKRHAQG